MKKETIFISSGLSGGQYSTLASNTKEILSENYTVLTIQFANDPEFNTPLLKDYSEVTLNEIFKSFKDTTKDLHSSIYIMHSFSSLLAMYYILDNPKNIILPNKIILLDPTIAENAYAHILSNGDNFILDKSMLDELKQNTTRELIDKIKNLNINVIEIESDTYNTNHDFDDLGTLCNIYKYCGLSTREAQKSNT